MPHPNSPNAVDATPEEIEAANERFTAQAAAGKHDDLLIDGFLIECEKEVLNLVKLIMADGPHSQVFGATKLKDALANQVSEYVDDNYAVYGVQDA